MPDAATEPAGSLDRQSMSVGEFNDLLTYSGGGWMPTTHAPIIRDDNELLIYAERSKNANSQWEIRGYRILGHDVRFSVADPDRADLAAIFIEEFDGDALTTDETYAQRRPIRHGVPDAVAADGKPAVAAWFAVRGDSREEISDVMDVGSRTVGEYLSRFRRRGSGLPDDLNVPEVGEIVESVPAAFDPIPSE